MQSVSPSILMRVLSSKGKNYCGRVQVVQMGRPKDLMAGIKSFVRKLVLQGLELKCRSRAFSGDMVLLPGHVSFGRAAPECDRRSSSRRVAWMASTASAACDRSWCFRLNFLSMWPITGSSPDSLRSSCNSLHHPGPVHAPALCSLPCSS